MDQPKSRQTVRGSTFRVRRRGGSNRLTAVDEKGKIDYNKEVHARDSSEFKQVLNFNHATEDEIYILAYLDKSLVLRESKTFLYLNGKSEQLTKNGRYRKPIKQGVTIYGDYTSKEGRTSF